jgi:hypothetical protein
MRNLILETLNAHLQQKMLDFCTKHYVGKTMHIEYDLEDKEEYYDFDIDVRDASIVRGRLLLEVRIYGYANIHGDKYIISHFFQTDRIKNLITQRLLHYFGLSGDNVDILYLE